MTPHFADADADVEVSRGVFATFGFRPLGVSGGLRVWLDAPPTTSARVTATCAAAIMGAPEHAGHDIAVIDLVAHLYGNSTTSRRQLANLWCVTCV